MIDRHNKTDDIAYFLAFCTEIYKKAQGISGKQAAEALASSGVLSYLEENFEVLHTQGPEWILEEINDFIENHK